jgi:hypothetical protein
VYLSCGVVVALPNAFLVIWFLSSWYAWVSGESKLPSQPAGFVRVRSRAKYASLFRRL